MDLMTAMLASKLAGLNPSGGGGGVSSWNDIPDKPDGLPYVEKKYGVILPETTVEIDPSAGMGALLDVLPMVDGREYTVKWNGTDYACTAQRIVMDDGIVGYGLGNVGVLMGGAPTNEPFVIACVDEASAELASAGCMIAALDGSESVTVSISGEIDTVHPIDPRSLPGAESFDLIALGLDELTAGGEEKRVECNVNEILAAARVGTVKFKVLANGIKSSPTASFGSDEFTIPVNLSVTNNMAFGCASITPYCQFYISFDGFGITAKLTLDE